MEKEIYKKYLKLKSSKIAETLDDKELMKMAAKIITTKEVAGWIEALTDVLDYER